MARKDITAGVKSAKVVAARFIESKSGKPAIEICFSFVEKSTETEEKLFWQGWLSEAAIDHTMKTLVEVLEYNGSLEVDDEGVLTDKKAFTDKEVSITVELEARRDEEGQEKLDEEGNTIVDPRIKWVNKAGGSAYSGMDVKKVQSSLKAIGFKAAFQSAKKKAGTPAAAPKNENEKQPSMDENDEVPW